MSKEIVVKKLTQSDFKAGELITDAVGNIFATRIGVARILDSSLPTLRAFHKRKGLLPLARRINGKQVYWLEDVINYYCLREK